MFFNEVVGKKNKHKNRKAIWFEYITTAELASEIGVTVKGIEYHISKLKTDGIIKRIGSDRGGYWEVEE